jgi:hypothetical protein
MSPRSAALGLVVACLAAAAHAGAAVAGPSAVPVGPAAALAGDRAVTVLGEPPHEARVVLRGTGGASVRLATLSAPGYKHASVYAESVAASATTWAVALKAALLPDAGEEPNRDRGELIVSGPVAGGPVRTLAACARDAADDVDPIDLAVAGDDVAWSSASCPDATGVRFAPAGGPVTLVGTGSRVELTPSWVGYLSAAAGRRFVGLLDRASGALRQVRTGAIAAFALGDTGVGAVVAADDPACSGDGCRMSIMRVATDGTIVRPGLAATPVGIPGFSVSPLVAGGGRVLGVRAHGNGVVAVDLATGARSYAGALGLGSDDTEPLAVDATNATFLARRCDGGREVRVEPTVPIPPGRLSFVPCPVRVLAHTLTLRRGHRTALLPVVCPRGCDDDWQLDYRGHAIGLILMRARSGVRDKMTVELGDLRRLRQERRITATLRPDSFGTSHPHAERQAPIRIVVRLAR